MEILKVKSKEQILWYINKTTKGFSVRNLKNIARFYRDYPEIEIVQTPSAQFKKTMILIKKNSQLIVQLTN